MDDADLQNHTITSVLLGLALIFLNSHLSDEVVFPGNAAFCIITFFFTYPDCGTLRHLCFSFFLSFADFFFLQTLASSYNFPSFRSQGVASNYQVLILEFLFLFILINMMAKKEIYREFKNPMIRTTIFMLKGYVRASGMVLTLKIVEFHMRLEPERAFVWSLVWCGVQAALPAVVYVVDLFCCKDVPVRHISLSGVVSLGKLGVALAGIAVIIDGLQEKIVFLEQTNLASVIIYLYYISLYSKQSVKYAKYFVQKIE